MRRLTLWPILAIALAMVGCAASTIDKDTGSEDALPLDGKADSFRAPTEHGELRMGSTASQAELSADEKFHAWTFALSGQANVALRVSARNENLDTVLYLYHRTSSDESWGSYVVKNDDANDDTLFSAIERELGEGEYRIIVKGFKERHRGPFSVSAECSGGGCESRRPGGDIEIPAATDFTASCVNRLWEALGAPIQYGDSFGIHPEASDGFDREVLVANAHYAGMSDWDEYVYDDERAEFTFGVDFVRTSAGSVVTMSDGGDESTTEYAFDADGNLLAYYVHNQSPWTEFYCGQEGDDDTTYPDEDCVSAWINGGPHRESSVNEGSETYSPDLPNDEINDNMRAAMAVYVESELDGEDGEITIEFKEWEDNADDPAGEYLLSAEGAAMVSYAVVNRWRGPVVVFASSENAEGPEMICAQPLDDR